MKNYLKYFFALLLFGSNGIVASNISLSSYEIVFLRTLLGSLLLIAMFAMSKKKINFKACKRDLIYITVSGIAMGCSWMLLYEAYAQTGVGIATLLYYSGPVIVMVLSPLIFGEKLTAPKIIGFAAVIFGIIFMNGKGGSINPFGFFCGIMSAVTYSVMVISNKKSKSIVGVDNSMIQLVVSFITVSVFVGFKTHFNIHINPRELPWIFILGLLNTGLGCYFYFSSIGHLPVQTVAICGYIEPLSAVVLSVMLLGEVLSPIQLAGAALIIGGAIFGECFKFNIHRKQVS